MISIGADYGGPELKETTICRSIQRVALAFKKMRAPDQPILLNPIFVVPGTVSGKLPFQGIQYGKFSAKQPCLATLVAVPPEQINNPGLMEYLLLELRGCNAMAFEFYRKKGIVFPLREAEALITKVAEVVGPCAQ